MNHIVCPHRTFNMYFKCDKEHYHCISCGIFLTDNIKLRKTLNHSKIFKLIVACELLTR